MRVDIGKSQKAPYASLTWSLSSFDGLSSSQIGVISDGWHLGTVSLAFVIHSNQSDRYILQFSVQIAIQYCSTLVRFFLFPFRAIPSFSCRYLRQWALPQPASNVVSYYSDELHLSRDWLGSLRKWIFRLSYCWSWRCFKFLSVRYHLFFPAWLTLLSVTTWIFNFFFSAYIGPLSWGVSSRNIVSSVVSSADTSSFDLALLGH